VIPASSDSWDCQKIASDHFLARQELSTTTAQWDKIFKMLKAAGKTEAWPTWHPDPQVFNFLGGCLPLPNPSLVDIPGVSAKMGASMAVRAQRDCVVDRVLASHR
jgi:hypothetical protein